MGWKMNRLYLLLVLFIVMATSCDTNTIYSKFQKVDKDGWTVKESLPFEFEIKDTEQPYDIEVAVRHDKNYEYSNLWVKVVNDDGKIFEDEKPTQLKLADKTGQWLGKCSNTYCTQKVLLKENFSFPDTGEYALSVRQHMRVDELEHVKAVGVVVMKSGVD